MHISAVKIAFTLKMVGLCKNEKVKVVLVDNLNNLADVFDWMLQSSSGRDQTRLDDVIDVLRARVLAHARMRT